MMGLGVTNNTFGISIFIMLFLVAAMRLWSENYQTYGVYCEFLVCLNCDKVVLKYEGKLIKYLGGTKNDLFIFSGVMSNLRNSYLKKHFNTTDFKIQRFRKVIFAMSNKYSDETKD